MKPAIIHEIITNAGGEITIKKTQAKDSTFQYNPNGLDIIITDQTMPGMSSSDFSR